LFAERRQIEQLLCQSQKMEAIGQLTAGVAHDFNNLLGVIVGNVELLLETAQGNAKQAELADTLMKNVMGGAELTRRLLAFARQQPLHTSIINLNERLPAITGMLQRTLGENIRVVTALADGLWLTRADASQVENALINLAINARDAMPKGGDFTIETANINLNKRYAAQHPEVVPGDYVMLSVTDTGCGMSPEVIERAVDPFFTTKPLGKGTGLGLSLIYGFIRQSGGHLKIESKVGAGTTVKLYLPKAQSEAANANVETNTPKVAPRGGELILVVDDNIQLRQLVVRQLTDFGYKVRAAGDGPEALKILNFGERFDLLFTDIGLPEGMTGHELAKAAREQKPLLKILFTTGYADMQNGHGNGQDDPVHMLRKPYRRQELAEKVRETLDSI
jgi:nitrogen-specific signal transduction histidine kinase/CheY-like chemotaxis protein